jgi:hypothetical protein
MPVIPPTPWQANTSKASSIFPLEITYYKVTYNTTKYTNEYGMWYTNPGVIATNPTTVPIQAPIAESLCPRILSKIPKPSSSSSSELLSRVLVLQCHLL